MSDDKKANGVDNYEYAPSDNVQFNIVEVIETKEEKLIRDVSRQILFSLGFAFDLPENHEMALKVEQMAKDIIARVRAN